MTPPPATPAKQQRKKWPPAQDGQLRALYPDTPNADIAALLGCTVKQVGRRADTLGLYKTQAYKQALASHYSRLRSPWTLQTEELMVLLYPHAMPGEMEALLGLGRMPVLSKASAMGLKKTKAVRSRVASVRQARLRERQGEDLYRQSRYLPGNVPWHTGTKGQHTGGGATRYQKGNKPPTLLPVGSVRVRTISGVPNVLMEKVAQPDKWRQVAHLVWEIANDRPLPHNHIIVFKDGCRHNLNPDNLQLLNRTEWALRISPLCNPNVPPEHADVLRLRGALTRGINSAQKRIDRAEKAATTPSTQPESKP